MATKKQEKAYTRKTKGRAKLCFQKPYSKPGPRGIGSINVCEPVTFSLEYGKKFVVSEVMKSTEKIRKWAEEGYQTDVADNGKPILTKLTAQDLTKFLEMAVKRNKYVCYWDDRKLTPEQAQFEKVVKAKDNQIETMQEEMEAMRAKLAAQEKAK